MVDYNIPMDALHRIAIVFVLLGLILMPRPYYGWLNLRSARILESTGQPNQAVEKYAHAAERMFWRDDLWEMAGIAALDGGDVETAIDYLEKAHEQGAIDEVGWLAMGDAYTVSGDFQAALLAWQNAGDTAAAYERIATTQRTMGNLPAAIQNWKALLALEPENNQAHYQMGLLLATSNPEAALAELMQAERDPGLTLSVQAMRTALNAALLSEDETYQMMLIGRALAAQGDWDLAAAAFGRANSLQEEYAPAWAWMGEAEQQLGRDGRAYLEKAIQLDPRSAMNYVFYGIYWQRQGNIQKAIDAYKTAVQLEPQVAAWHTALAGAYEQQGDLPDAISEHLRAVELDPGDSSGWRALALFCIMTGYDLEETGISAVETLLDLEPDDWRSQDIAGQLAFARGKYQEAQGRFEQAIQLAPDQAEVHLHLALVYLEFGNRSSAKEELYTVIALDPDGQYSYQASRTLDLYFP